MNFNTNSYFNIIMKNGTVENEAKILEIDLNSVIKKIEENNGKKIFQGNLFMIFLDTEDGKIRKNSNNLRIRLKENEINNEKITEVTLKGRAFQKGSIKSVMEYEFNSDSFEKTLELFEKLGYNIISKIKKYRISYEFENTTVEIDKYEGIPHFLEIESTDNEKIINCAKLLGFQENMLKSWSMKELFKHYGIKKKNRNDF